MGVHGCKSRRSQVNKESKVWQHGEMNALDWLRIFHNLGKLTKASVQLLWMIHFVFHGSCVFLKVNIHVRMLLI